MTSKPAFSNGRVPMAQAMQAVAARFERAGVAAPAARAVARAQVLAEADGLKGHGLSRVPTYLALIASGKVDGQAEPTLTRPRPGVLLVDAGHGFAYAALDLALTHLPQAARETGIALAAIRRSNHCGAAGQHVERLAEAGLVGLLMANTPAAMAPWGGSRPLFGTNPIAFAAPVPDHPPLVIDMALSKVARGPIVAASLKGEPIPEGWALDANGQPTTDARAALAGTMVPMGDAKGATLALMVEILAGALVGAHLSFESASFIDGEGAPLATGQVLIAIDPGALGGSFGARMTTLVSAIEAQAGTRLPGERRQALRARAHAEGIDMTGVDLG